MNNLENNLKIEKAQMQDMPRIQEIYEYARKFMRENGNPNQWKDNSPKESVLENDIANGNLYVIKSDNEIHGVFAFILGEDVTYRVIEQGEWLSNDEYGTIHRVAGDGKVKGIVEAAVNYAAGRISHLRIDTHEDNKVMQHVISKNGFKRCGIIYVADGTPRIAFERL